MIGHTDILKMNILLKLLYLFQTIPLASFETVGARPLMTEKLELPKLEGYYLAARLWALFGLNIGQIGQSHNL